MHTYEVALWRYWPSMFPEWIEEIEDFSPQSAMYAAMRLHGLRFVQKRRSVSAKRGRMCYRVPVPLCNASMLWFALGLVEVVVE